MQVRVFSQSTGLQNNAYVLVQDRSALVIDPSFLVEEIERFLDQENLLLVGILLTHAHFDHMGDGQLLAERRGVMVHISAADRPLFEHRLLSKWRSYDADFRTAFFTGAPAIDGFAVQVVPMPGHSPGSVGYAVGGHFFTGDAVLQVNLGPDSLPLSSPRDFDRTVREFMVLPDDWVIMPGHYGHGRTLREVKQTNPELLARLGRIA